MCNHYNWLQLKIQRDLSPMVSWPLALFLKILTTADTSDTNWKETSPRCLAGPWHWASSACRDRGRQTHPLLQGQTWKKTILKEAVKIKCKSGICWPKWEVFFTSIPNSNRLQKGKKSTLLTEESQIAAYPTVQYFTIFLTASLIIFKIKSYLPIVSRQLLEPTFTREPSWTFGGSFGYWESLISTSAYSDDINPNRFLL